MLFTVIVDTDRVIHSNMGFVLSATKNINMYPNKVLVEIVIGGHIVKIKDQASERLVKFCDSFGTPDNERFARVDCHRFISYLHTSKILDEDCYMITSNYRNTESPGAPVAFRMADSRIYWHSAIFLYKDPKGTKYYLGTSGYRNNITVQSQHHILQYFKDNHVTDGTKTNVLKVESGLMVAGDGLGGPFQFMPPISFVD